MVTMHGNVVLGTKSLLLYVVEMQFEKVMQACDVCIKFDMRCIVL